MNTSFYWRSQLNNLLSYEFLKLVKKHLLPGGVLYYNATGSRDIPYTAAHVFEYMVSFGSFIAVSDSPFDQTPEEKRNSLMGFHEVRGRPVFEGSSQADTLASSLLKDIREETLKRDGLFLITDDNLASEFKTNNRFYVAQKKWLELVDPSK